MNAFTFLIFTIFILCVLLALCVHIIFRLTSSVNFYITTFEELQHHIDFIEKKTGAEHYAKIELNHELLRENKRNNGQ